MKYLLDATKERLEKAPRVEGKNYERLYPAETAEPVFVYWDVEWIAKPDEAKRLRFAGVGESQDRSFVFRGPCRPYWRFWRRSRLSESKIASKSAILEAQLMH